MKALVDEFFKAFGIDKTCDDVFTLKLLPDLYRLTDHYGERINDLDVAIKPTEKLDYYKIRDIIEEVLTGETKAPMWMRVIDETDPFEIDEEDEYECGCSTTLYITPKDPKHAKLAQLFSNFLYSTRSEEGSC